MGRRPLLAIAAFYLLGLLLVLVTPVARQLNRLTVLLWDLGQDLGLPASFGPNDYGFGLNVLLFVPLGMLLAGLVRVRWWVAALVAVIGSASIELVQFWPVLERFPSWGDVVANGLGGLVGALLAVWWERRTTRD